ncbi:hypothetical protein BEWA_013710 [Theileria equi strain WA]|uniref:Uncharacterized protein n=1 Tax=Theileria equi strain WA TaxID=1537102 RepID=L1LBL9_THEEQ|nr:hypothetical protein BEWA_013710 [Theileria equi strain WA]EKX72812.1 hypothetical protein BEWA_013710 [Theileria equi strain WA]|eukprot:XP_004832264.1 hypothetical protein BEWA_013710 [Theileria equi strain WA]
MGGTYSVVADISRNVSNGVKTSYRGKNGNSIGLTRIDEPEIRKSDEGGEDKDKLRNYKFYYHAIPEDNAWWSVYYQLQRVEHNGIEQTGLDGKGYLSTYREVRIIYWLSDEHNSFPLIIGLGTPNVTYYKRLVNVIGNGWESAGITHPADLSDYNKVLCELNNGLKSIVIVNLNAKNGQNYCGHPSVKQGESPPESCKEESKFLTVSVECDSQLHKGFNKYTHKFNDNAPMKILSALHSGNIVSFGKRDISKQYKEVNVYYSSTDSGRNKPLIIGLAHFSGGQSEYYTFDGKLARNHSIKEPKLLDHLDEQNCMRNNIIVADLSKKGRYCCGMSKHRKIQVHQIIRNNVPAGYTSYLHLPTDSAIFSIHRFKSVDHIHTFSNLSGWITGIYAYFCNNDLNKPLLLYVNQGSGYGKWFKRTSVESNNWTEDDLSSLKIHTPTFHSIKQPIKDILHNICKEVGIVGCKHAPEVSTESTTASPVGSVSNSSDSGSGSSHGGGGGSASITPNSSSVQQNTDTGQYGDAREQGSAVGHTPPGKSGPTGPAGEEGSSSSSGSGTSGSDRGAGVGSERTSATGQGKDKTFLQKALAFFQTTPGIITVSVTPSIGGLIGVTIWKGPALLARLITRL